MNATASARTRSMKMTRRALGVDADGVLEAAASRRILLNCIWILRKPHLRIASDHCRPFADAPVRHHAIRHVRIGGCEPLGGIRRVAAEQQHRAVRWIRQRSAE